MCVLIMLAIICLEELSKFPGISELWMDVSFLCDVEELTFYSWMILCEQNIVINIKIDLVYVVLNVHCTLYIQKTFELSNYLFCNILH